MDYIPYKDSERILWNNNLNAKIDAQGVALGLVAADIAAIKTLTAANAAAIKASNDAKLASKAASAAKVAQLKAGNLAIRGFVRKMKSSSTYNASIGTTLEIIGSYDTVNDYNSHKPTIKVRVMPGRVRINYVKKGLDGINVYGRLKGETTWLKIAYDSYSPFEDSRPLAVANMPEHREFMAIGVLRDKEVTLQSAIVEAVFGG